MFRCAQWTDVSIVFGPPDAAEVLGAAAEQEDEEQNRNRNPQQPQQNVPGGGCFFNFFTQVHLK